MKRGAVYPYVGAKCLFTEDNYHSPVAGWRLHLFPLAAGPPPSLSAGPGAQRHAGASGPAAEPQTGGAAPNRGGNCHHRGAGGAGGGLALLVLRLVVELRAWSERLPEAFPALWNSALDQVERWYISSPPFLRSALDNLALHLTEEGPSLAGTVGNWLMGAASRLLAALPDAGLFLVTTVLAVYFTSLSYPAILAFLKRQLPRRWQSRCRAAARCCRTAMLQWLRSELTLIAVTFLLLLIGFFWIGLDFALLAATFTALVDALPVLGVGTVLVPWALGCLLLGQPGQALALAALYAVVSVTHSLLEPRLLAGQGDLSPISALLAMYLGFQFMGVGGMILMPVVLLLLKQLQDAGVIRLWK